MGPLDDTGRERFLVLSALGETPSLGPSCLKPEAKSLHKGRSSIKTWGKKYKSPDCFLLGPKASRNQVGMRLMAGIFPTNTSSSLYDGLHARYDHDSDTKPPFSC